MIGNASTKRYPDKHRCLKRTAKFWLTGNTFNRLTDDQTVTNTCSKCSKTKYNCCCQLMPMLPLENPP